MENTVQDFASIEFDGVCSLPSKAVKHLVDDTDLMSGQYIVECNWDAVDPSAYNFSIGDHRIVNTSNVEAI